MTVAVTLPGGAAGTVESWDGATLVVASPRAFAPGAPVSLDAAGLTVEAKTIGSKRRADGAFEVRLRVVNLRREARAQLDALFPGLPHA